MPNLFVLALQDCDATRASLIGGKGLGLGALTALGHTVPAGFVVTTDAFRACVASDGLLDEIANWTSALSSSTDNSEVSERIEKEILRRGMSTSVRKAVLKAYEGLGVVAPVAVRSSATAEDTEDASFAGQQDTYLWVRGADAVVEHIVRCWASLFSTQAIGYRRLVGVPDTDAQMAVVVQCMVDAEAAGVMMTLHPVTGDREVLYVESAFGLGEAVVRGEVDADRIVVAKSDLAIRSAELGNQAFAYRFVPASGTVERVDCNGAGAAATLSDAEAIALATLGRTIETQFGRPMDIEWAIDSNRTIQLLQARPETVWSHRPTRDAVKDAIGRLDDWDPIHTYTDNDVHWATSNMGEAMPGTQTPLSWTVWAHGVEKAPREAAYQLGALSRAEREVPLDPKQRCLRVFYGRPAFNAAFLATVGNRLPGTTGQATVSSILGRAPESIDYTPTKRRYPIIAWRMPLLFARTTGLIRRNATDQEAWYRDVIPRVAALNETAARQLLVTAWERHVTATVIQTLGVMGVMQPLYEAVKSVAQKFGGDMSTLTGPPGGAEMAVVSDIWALSRNLLDLPEFLRRHGFHGPAEGELRSRVWREDTSSLLAMVEAYRAQPDNQEPALLDAARRQRHAAAEQQVLSAASWVARPGVRFALRLARTRLPMRGIAKRSFLQAFDVVRAASRRLADLWVADGRLDRTDDVFFLTYEELRDGLPADARELVAQRRKRHAAYSEMLLPAAWQGAPEVEIVSVASSAAADGDVTGIGVSAGVVEGRARVLMTPDFAAVKAGEILIAPATDPSWSSIMFIASGLVVDIGGALSHAAVVAREMGQPCVVNTRIGTRTIRTGDRVRVDGATGGVTILERA